jgi:hypothetical protein
MRIVKRRGDYDVLIKRYYRVAGISSIMVRFSSIVEE